MSPQQSAQLQLRLARVAAERGVTQPQVVTPVTPMVTQMVTPVTRPEVVEAERDRAVYMREYRAKRKVDAAPKAD